MRILVRVWGFSGFRGLGCLGFGGSGVVGL